MNISSEIKEICQKDYSTFNITENPSLIRNEDTTLLMRYKNGKKPLNLTFRGVKQEGEYFKYTFKIDKYVKLYYLKVSEEVKVKLAKDNILFDSEEDEYEFINNDKLPVFSDVLYDFSLSSDELNNVKYASLFFYFSKESSPTSNFIKLPFFDEYNPLLPYACYNDIFLSLYCTSHIDPDKVKLEAESEQITNGLYDFLLYKYYYVSGLTLNDGTNMIQPTLM